MTQTVGSVYAEGLFLLAQEEQKEKQIYEELNQITDLLQNYPEFIALLDVPTLELSERISALQKVIGTQNGITENFLCLLVEKRRINRISDIRQAFNKLYYDYFKIAEVFVISAIALNEQQKQVLKDKMKQKLGKEILLRESVDPSLMGGMIVQYGDTRMDNSVKSRLQQFAQQ